MIKNTLPYFTDITFAAHKQKVNIMKNLFVIILVTLFGFLNAQNVTLYNHENAPFDSQNRISAVTRIGDNLWVGEDIAINKFDGTNWERFIYTDINCPWEYLWVYSIQEDAEGNIWAAGGGGLHKFDGENWFYFGEGTPGIELYTDQFNDMVITEDNQMVICGGNTVWSWIYTVDLSTMTFTYFNRDDHPLLDDIIQDIFVNDNNEIILAGNEGGLIEFDGTNFVAHEAVINFEICGDEEGNYWSGGWAEDHVKGLHVYNSEFEEVQSFNPNNSLIPFPRVYRNAFNNNIDNEIWFRTSELVLEDGVICIYNTDKEYFQILDTESGMPGTRAGSFFFEEDVYWICLDNMGLAKIDLNESPFISLESGNMEFDVTAGSLQEVELPILNNGAGTLSYEIDLSESESWLSVDETNGTFNGSSTNHSLIIDVTDISEPTTLNSHLFINSNGGHLRFNITVHVDIFDGIETISQDKLVFPNPTQNNIHIGDINGLQSITIYNMMGQLVYSQDHFENSEILLNNMDNGQYIIELKYKSQTQIGKIIKK